MPVRLAFALCCFCCLIACSGPGDQNMAPEKPLFTLVSSAVSGLTFRNDLKDGLYENALFFDYFYNGGGVAAGDVNGDNLPDIYLVANQQANHLYLNRGKLSFEDVTNTAGVAGTPGFSTGVTMVDINHDGLLDIYVCKAGMKNLPPEQRQNELFINLGTDASGVPRFENQAEKYGLNLSLFSTQAAFFDYDRDGDLDCFLVNYGPESYSDELVGELKEQKVSEWAERLYRNDDGKFHDVSEEAGLINTFLGFGLGVAVSDLNRDGWPDVYVANDFSGRDHLYFNQQNGSFREAGLQTTNHTSNFAMGCDIADYNNDAWADIVVLDMTAEDNYNIKASMSGMNPDRFQRHVDAGLHHQYMYNTLQINRGIDIQAGLPMFSEVAQFAGIASTDWSWAPLFFDMDNDGWQDLFVSNGIEKNYRNNDYVNEVKKVQEKLFATGKKLSNEMELMAYVGDLLSKMPDHKKENYFFHNRGDLQFEKMNAKWIPDQPASASQGAVYADLDRDGDLDLVVNNTNAEAFLYENHASQQSQNHYLQIKLKGGAHNTQGIGTKVTIICSESRQIRELYPARGFQSSVESVLHFGLGQNAQVDSMKIIWPDGRIQVLANVRADQQLTLSYEDAMPDRSAQAKEKPLFRDIAAESGLDFLHHENTFDDYVREPLLPHRYSQSGPALAVADWNGDGLDDVFVGGAKGYPGTIFFQLENEHFIQGTKQPWYQDREYEDVVAVAFDADNDGDIDLYVGSGGNEEMPGHSLYQDRLYFNDGKGNFTQRPGSLPVLRTSTGAIHPWDFDNDGDEDLLVGGKVIPGRYPHAPQSFFLENQEGIFTDATETIAPQLSHIGMVSAAVDLDYDGDGDKDLLVAGEWMALSLLENKGGKLALVDLPVTSSDLPALTSLSQTTGWWYSLSTADMDGDGDQDIVAGNLGLNYKYKATPEAPFEVYSADLDQNGQSDIVLGYHQQAQLFPLRGRQCSSQQIPEVKSRFPTYDAFARATLAEVYGPMGLDSALHLKAATFASCYLENKGGAGFALHLLPAVAQLAPVNVSLIQDIDGDGVTDILLAGNLYQAEVETPRGDAGYGVFLKGDGQGNWSFIPNAQTGLFLGGDIKQGACVSLGAGKHAWVFAKNQSAVQLIVK
ncbi:MAG: VCBS repeat-containing protein [Bacteroidia bacterium]